MLRRLTNTVLPMMLAVALALAPRVAVAASAPLVTAPQVDTPTRVLFVGNSYLYYGDSVHNHVRRMVVAADPGIEMKLKYKSATIGGAALAHHNIDHLTKPGQIGVKEPFQLVILQGGSGEPLSARRKVQFSATVVEFNKVIAARGGKTALYLDHLYVHPHKRANAENIGQTEDLIVSVANEIGALVIPVGLAFDEAYRRRPDINLHKGFDGTHPDLIGTYLAACTVYASVYGRSPVGNSYDYYGKIDKETAGFLQQVAADTVKKFYGPRARRD
ncbi:MAG: hypothetical protein D4S02_10755 [Rhodocyclaceae bacterium]|nr:MAG: hypothetical protein D4S02_10755 [Rhodocyclaceae bacterium]